MASVALACALAGPPVASAEFFEVNDVADAVDATVGSDGCLTVGGKCTLRAALEESNASVGEMDSIAFDELVFEGQASSTIALGGGLPTIVDSVWINGRECSTAAGVIGPCVGIEGPSGGTALSIEGTDGVEIENLAVTGAETGISVVDSESFRVLSSWFGVDLAGEEAGNTTGLFVGSEAAKGRVGGEGPGTGNLFGGNVGEGLRIHGASNIRVLGNYFGVERDGVSQIANGEDIEITSAVGAEAVGNSIGTKVRPEAAATPECDGGCNLISGATSHGVDLQGDGGAEEPAVATTIAGNNIGLDAAGAVAIPNATAGIRVGEAAQTVIGGPKVGEANRINGGDVAIVAGPDAPDLVVRGNRIGLDTAGTGELSPPGEGIVVSSEGLFTPAVEALIEGNDLWMEGGVAIAQRGFGATISGNEIFGASTGIRTHGPTKEHGNLIEGNSLEALEESGILVENNLNEVLGNEIASAGGAGIRVKGPPPHEVTEDLEGVTENLIGGDTAAEENRIVFSGGAAIEIATAKTSFNHVARNRGFANGGSFIDLVSLTGGEPPNNAIEPPEIAAAIQTGAGGSAEVGARVRVFRKQVPASGEVDSFLGEAIAASDGSWSVAFGDLPAGTTVAATQTNIGGGTSELATAVIGGDSDGGGGGATGGGGGGSSASDATRPQTKILGSSKTRSEQRIAWFKFDSDEFGTTFQCRLDGATFRSCKSPTRYRGLKVGRHVFEVRAVDASGNADGSPARKRFTILARKGKR